MPTTMTRKSNPRYNVYSILHFLDVHGWWFAGALIIMIIGYKVCQ